MVDSLARKRLWVGAGVVFTLFASWFALSPYIVVWQLQNAVRHGDASTVAALADLPLLRESAKASLVAAPASAAFGAGLAMLLAGPALDRVVDGVLSPQGLISMIAGGSRSAHPAALEMHYVSLDRFAVAFVAAPAHARLEARLCRENLFSWRLCSIALGVP